MEIQIGRREYTVEGTKTTTNRLGQNQTWTDLRGKRGASVVLVETEHKYGVAAELFHGGRKSPWESVDRSTIKR